MFARTLEFPPDSNVRKKVRIFFSRASRAYQQLNPPANASESSRPINPARERKSKLVISNVRKNIRIFSTGGDSQALQQALQQIKPTKLQGFARVPADRPTDAHEVSLF
jgi:hypothetical protein